MSLLHVSITASCSSWSRQYHTMEANSVYCIQHITQICPRNSPMKLKPPKIHLPWTGRALKNVLLYWIWPNWLLHLWITCCTTYKPSGALPHPKCRFRSQIGQWYVATNCFGHPGLLCPKFPGIQRLILGLSDGVMQSLKLTSPVQRSIPTTMGKLFSKDLYLRTLARYSSWRSYPSGQCFRYPQQAWSNLWTAAAEVLSRFLREESCLGSETLSAYRQQSTCRSVTARRIHRVSEIDWEDV